MHNELFADGIGDIAVTGSVVRIDFVSLSPNERDAKGNPRAVFRERVIMPLEGFVRMFGAVEQVMHKLVQSGIIERRDTAPEGQPGTAVAVPRPATRPEGDAAPPSVMPRSPNFD